MFPFFLDAGRVLVSPWGGGYTFSEPGMKKVAAELCHFTVGKTAKDVLWILAEKLVLML